MFLSSQNTPFASYKAIILASEIPTIKSPWGTHWTRSNCLNSIQWTTGILNSPNYFLNSSIFLVTAARSISFITLFITCSVILTEKLPSQPFKMLYHISPHIFPQIKRSISIQSFNVWKLLNNFDQPFYPLFIYTYLRILFPLLFLLQTFSVSPHLYYTEKKKGTSTSCSKLFMNKKTAQYRTSWNSSGDLLQWKLVMHLTLFLIFWQIIYSGKPLLLSQIFRFPSKVFSKSFCEISY